MSDSHSRAARPPFIRHFSEIPAKASFSYTGSTERFGHGAPLTRFMGFQRLGIWHETIVPGRRSSWPHAHSREEEFVYVLEGVPQVWVNGEVYDLVPGDVVAFVPGTGDAHAVINNSESDVKLIVAGEQVADGDLIYYPLHPARNEECRAQGFLWENPPSVALGLHDGLSDRMRAAGAPTEAPMMRAGLREEPAFETERLIVRMASPKDAAAIARYQTENREHLADSMPTRTPEFFMESWWKQTVLNFLMNFQANQSLRLFVFDKKNMDELVGTIAYTNFRRGPLQACNLGYGLAEKYVGKGYMVEALRPTLDYVFSTLAIHRIEASYRNQNARSGAVLKRLGFTVEGEAKSYLKIRGAWEDHVLTSLIAPV